MEPASKTQSWPGLNHKLILGRYGADDGDHIKSTGEMPRAVHKLEASSKACFMSLSNSLSLGNTESMARSISSETK